MSGLRAAEWMGTFLSSVAVGSVLLLGAWLVGATIFRRKPATRHLVLHAALLVYLLGPLWIAAARALPDSARQVMQPAARALAFLDAVDSTRSARAPVPAGSGQEGARREHSPGGAARSWGLALWGLGALALLLRLGHGWRRVQRLRRRATALPGDLGQWVQVTLQQRFPGRALPPVLLSPEAGAPLVLGLLRPAILLPAAALELDRTQLEHVLLHEMAHLLRGDLRVGLLQRLVAALHWPNPLVLGCQRALARAQEESCDDLVLAQARPADYARTLLAVATSRPPPAGAALGMSVNGSELESRIRRLLHRPDPLAFDESARQHGPIGAHTNRRLTAPPPSRTLATTAVLIALGGASAVALASVTTAAPAHAPAPVLVLPAPPAAGGSPAESADEAEARRHFLAAGPGVEGAFVLIDVSTGAQRTINPSLAAAHFTPVSTYKVVIAIAALETGVLADQSATLKWDGRPHPITAWNRDLDLHQAMKTSSNWYFEEVFRQIGDARMRAWVDKVRFGVTGFRAERPTWIDGGLLITPVQQAQFFARFAAGRLPVTARTQEILRRILVIDERDGVTLRAKTGTAALGTGTLAWLAGTVEQPGRSHAFATFFPRVTGRPESHRRAPSRHHPAPSRPLGRPAGRDGAMKAGLLLPLALALSPSASRAAAASGAAMPDLSRRLEQEAARARGEVAVHVTHLPSGRWAASNGSRLQPLYSVFKLPVAVTVLEQVQSGKLALDQRVQVVAGDMTPAQAAANPRWSRLPVELTVQQLLELSIVDSDNPSTDKLLGLIGGPAAVTRRLQALDLPGIEVKFSCRDQSAGQGRLNRGSAAALTGLLVRLQTGALLKPPQRALLLDMMTRSQTGLRRLRGNLPAATPVASKTGTGQDGKVTNDVGLITLPGGEHLAISVLVSGSALPPEEQRALIATLARIAYDALAAAK